MVLLACLTFAIGASAYDRYDYNTGFYINYVYEDGEQIAEITYDDETNTHYSGAVVVPSQINIGAMVDHWINVKYIGRNAFEDCYNMTSIDLPIGIKTIGESAFSCCTKITTVTIPYTVTRVNYNAFGDCDNLTSVIIGTGLTYIGTYGFDSPLSYIHIYTSTPPKSS